MVKAFFVPGAPQGKGRPRVTKYGTFTPEKTRNYENLIRAEYLRKYSRMGKPAEGKTYLVQIVALFAPPRSYSKKRRAAMIGTPYTHKPDADNIAKAVLDAINGIAFTDDAAVVELHVKKYYANDAEEGVSVVISDEITDKSCGLQFGGAM